MVDNPLLGPVIALVAWTLVMLVWMAATRMPAMRKAGMSIATRRGGRGADLEGKIPPEATWPGHNYAHLLEQPTIFYAIVLVLVALGDIHPINLWLAWGYVGLRIVHSIVQSTTNIVRYRMPLFMLSTICLLGLTLHAAIRFIHG